jgi:hypothetical protein
VNHFRNYYVLRSANALLIGWTIRSSGGSVANNAYEHVIVADFEFEFGGRAGERPRPVCMVARDLCTGQEWRRWRYLLREPALPPLRGPLSDVQCTKWPANTPSTPAIVILYLLPT